MLQVKIFMGAATAEGMQFLEDKINEWIEKENIKVHSVTTTMGKRKAEGLGGLEEREELFLIFLYEK